MPFDRSQFVVEPWFSGLRKGCSSRSKCGKFRKVKCVRVVASQGFTLIELLVVISIIGLLMAMLLPAVQMVREAGRRTVCLNNLKQQSLAVINLHDTQGRFPPGYTYPEQAMWSAFILPFMDQGNLYHSLDLSGPWTDPGSASSAACATYISQFQCPSSGVPMQIDAQGIDQRVPCTYLACASGLLNRESGEFPWVGDEVSDGIFYRNSRTSMKDITDGTSHTVLLGEAIFDFSIWGDDYHGHPQVVDHWYIGTRELIPQDVSYGDSSTEISECLGSTGCPINSTHRDDSPINDKELCFSSRHPGGTQVAFADGHVRFVSEYVDFAIWQAVGSRRNGEVNQTLD